MEGIGIAANSTSQFQFVLSIIFFINSDDLSARVGEFYVIKQLIHYNQAGYLTGNMRFRVKPDTAIRYCLEVHLLFLLRNNSTWSYHLALSLSLHFITHIIIIIIIIFQNNNINNSKTTEVFLHCIRSIFDFDNAFVPKQLGRKGRSITHTNYHR